MSEIDKLRQTMARLREPGGCPWDQEQTHASLTRCLIDETSELLETIDRADVPHMREELGDVLIQIVFHARLAEEAGLFNFDDVAQEINEKLIRRHPHVFGPTAGGIDTSEKVLVQWDQIKVQEKAAKASVNGDKIAGAETEKIFKDMPPRLPALMFAEVAWKQIDKKNLPHDGVVDRAQVQALGAQLDDALLGKMLFELAAAARAKGLDPEGALRRYTMHVMDAVEKKVGATK